MARCSAFQITCETIDRLGPLRAFVVRVVESIADAYKECFCVTILRKTWRPEGCTMQGCPRIWPSASIKGYSNPMEGVTQEKHLMRYCGIRFRITHYRLITVT